MKFLENWIREYFKSNLNIKNIINKLNNNGFEISNNNIKNIKKNKKFLIKKIKINKNKLKKKYIKIFIYNKKTYIFIKNIKQNINNKNILIYKKEIKKKKYFYIFKKIINKNTFFILYKKKKILINILNTLNKNNYIEINIPNNRIDCHNIYGISRELNNLYKKKKIKIKKIKINFKKKIYKLNIKIKKNTYIKNYKYLKIKNIKIYKFNTPKLIKKRLKNIGIKIKNNLIDIINYILIESGQEIIILDWNKIKKQKINIEFIKNKYKKIDFYIKIKKNYIYKSINKYNVNFFPNKKTKNIIIIAPLFTNNYISININNLNKNTLKKYISNSDKNIQNIFLKKTIHIIKNICKGKIKNINIYINSFIKKENKIIKLKYKNINKIIGLKIKKKKIIYLIKSIPCKIIKKRKEYINILLPKWRSDIKIKEDVIEEIIKIYKYNKIPLIPPKIKLIIKKKKNNTENIKKIKNFFLNIGYQEVINFIFTNKKKENIFFNKNKNIKIINPINKKTSLIRTSLIPGLIKTISYNIKRQKENIKIFEVGTCFKKKNKKIKQFKTISAAIYGYKYIKNWFIKKNKKFNFYDIKGDLEYILKKQKKHNYFKIKKSKKKILEYKQGIDIKIKKNNIGYLGMLNKKIQKKFLFKNPVFILEIKLKKILFSEEKIKTKISKFPINKRDITLIINKNILINKIINKCLIKEKKIKNIHLIDIYKNKILKKKNYKNITLRFYIQDNKKNLKEIEIENIIKKCKNLLKKKFNAKINN